MQRKILYTALAAISAFFILTGCPDETKPEDITIITDPENPAVVSDFDLTGKISAPVKGGQPQTLLADTCLQYTGTIAWKAAGGAGGHSGEFAGGTVYTAEVFLTAKNGFTFTGVAENSFTHNTAGAGNVSNAADNGTVTIIFPETEPAAAVISKLDKVTAGNPINLGYPLPSTPSPYNSAVTKQGNINILCTVSSCAPYSILNIIDIENPNACRVLETYEVSTGNVWVNAVDSKGNYYFAGYDDGTRFYRYSPNNPEGQKLQQLGSSLRGAVTAITVDNEDNVYLNNSRTGDIMKWDVTANSFTNYGRILDSPEYARALVYYDGYLYGGSFTTDKFFRFNLSTRQMENLASSPLPSGAVIKRYETMMVVRNYLFAYIETMSNGWITSIYDLNEKTWIKYDTGAGYFPTGEIDGYVYFTDSGQALKKFNLATREITMTSVTPLPNYGLRGSGIADLTVNPQYSGKIFVSIYPGTSGDIIFINFATNARLRVSAVITGGDVELQNLAFLGDDYYASGYNINTTARININTGVRETYSMGQCEGMTPYNGKLYTGVYPNARIYEYNPVSKSSTELFTAGQSQDRPFQIKAYDNKLLIGTIPVSGQIGGALTVYDLNSKTVSVHRNIVQDQSVTGIACKDGKVYGSTTINGGLNAALTQTRAKLFIYDVNSGEKIKEATPAFTSSAAVTHIGELCFAPDGRLWGAAGGIIFEIDPETLEIITEVKVSGGGTFGTWRPVYMYFDANGIMFANPGGNLIAFDPDTEQYKNIAPGAAGRVVFFAMNDARETIVFNNGNFSVQVFRLDISWNE